MNTKSIEIVSADVKLVMYLNKDFYTLLECALSGVVRSS
jgi:hypothetical protein